MMLRHKISNDIGTPGIHSECEIISSLEDTDHYVIDVESIQHFEPVSMLLLGASLRKLKKRNNGHVQMQIVGRDDANIQGHSYAQRMGFWWSIGEDDHPPLPSSNPDGSTIPITRIDYSDLFRRSGLVDPVRSGEVSRAAAQAASTLAGSDKESPLWNALEYSLREMIRNTFEHSHSDSAWYTASTRPSKNDVQLALIDEGIGIRASLENSGQYSFNSDIEAIEHALRPGVSRNVGRKRSPDEEQRLREEHPGQDPARWDNSGYGLTLTTELCKHAGQYTIVSGRACKSYLCADIHSHGYHEGTALRFVLDPRRIPDALKAVGLTGAPKKDQPSHSLMTASQRLRLERENE